MRQINVQLGARSYAIHVGHGLLARLGTHCRKLGLGAQCVLVTDTHVARLHGAAARVSLSNAGISAACITLPSGERSKSLEQARRCYRAMAAHRLERGSFVVALGGGVVGDVAGFVAATYLRGMALVQVPTTLLAQVDSSVGGKVGVNLPEGKNLVGAFHQPRAVYCDLELLRSLPEREFRAGLAEVIKYGIIADARLFARLERDLEALLKRHAPTLEAVVARCCAIKAAVVGEDEREGGRRAILNFGHTLGHGLEAISRYGRYLHGEAISIGQVAAARLSQKLAGLPARDADRIEALFIRAGLPVRVSLKTAERRRLHDAMRLDKKVSAGEIRFVLAGALGRATAGHRVPMQTLLTVMEGT